MKSSERRWRRSIKFFCFWSICVVYVKDYLDGGGGVWDFLSLEGELKGE